MINRDISGMINLETVIGRDRMFLKILLDKLGTQITQKYLKLKESKESFDFGGKGIIKTLTALCRFIDSLGALFSDNYDKILKSEGNYDMMKLQKSMSKWNDERQAEAIGDLIDIFDKDLGDKK